MFSTSDFQEYTETHVFLDILEARSGHFWAHAAKVLKMTLSEAHSGHIWAHAAKVLKMSLLRLILAISRLMLPTWSK